MLTLAPELYWLTLTTLMTGLMWVPYIVNRLIEQSPLKAVWDPQGDTTTRVAWADRMMRAHQNAVENLVIFAPRVLALQIAGINSSTTASACVGYFLARLAHYVVLRRVFPWCGYRPLPSAWPHRLRSRWRCWVRSGNQWGLTPLSGYHSDDSVESVPVDSLMTREKVRIPV